MGRTLTFDELFTADFLSALTALSLVAKRVAAGGRHGERLSKDLGSGVEFKDYRPYSAGDDLRAIDWNVYRRLGKLSLRLFEEQQNLPLYVLPDVSESMFIESPPRIVAAVRITLALAAVGIEQHDSAGVFPFAEELQVLFKAISGRAGVMAIAQRLAHLVAVGSAGRTDLIGAIDTIGHMKLRPGLVVVISDFFDPRGLSALRSALEGLRHRLLLVQLIRASDTNPEYGGDVRLEDCETGELLDLTISPDILERYRAAYTSFQGELEQLASALGSHLLRIDVERDVVEQLALLFDDGALRL
ncbi:DUF58 domain-containing protein [Pseudoxanthomonas putridarboris]|uniref:DUF58 domain-containing protein n=1 Tax=Pseudoxanthomonas putridarboris TaxID=752605 RepID=A0ABU9IVQ2_9GAMM